MVMSLSLPLRMFTLPVMVGFFMLSGATYSVFAQPLPATNINEKALVTVRFNKPDVYYKSHLKTAVLQAMAIKQSAQFVLTNYVPKTPSSTRNAEHQRIARHNEQKLYEYMLSLGVSSSQIQRTRRAAPELLYDEVRVHVY